MRWNLDRRPQQAQACARIRELEERVMKGLLIRCDQGGRQKRHRTGQQPRASHPEEQLLPWSEGGLTGSPAEKAKAAERSCDFGPRDPDTQCDLSEREPSINTCTLLSSLPFSHLSPLLPPAAEHNNTTSSQAESRMGEGGRDLGSNGRNVAQFLIL